jgi:hypothetical protein
MINMLLNPKVPEESPVRIIPKPLAVEFTAFLGIALPSS